MKVLRVRAWDKHHKRWVSVEALDNYYNMRRETVRGIFYIEFLQDYDYEWVQYTGLKDKNGKEIYEGDILRSLLPFHLHGEVKFDNGEFYCRCRESYEKRIKINRSSLSNSNTEQIYIIIGNIYENPELLEEFK